MGTRGVIARQTGEHSFKGRYHHWDSYPTGLGATLYDLARTQFAGDVPRMLKVLLDEHPAGWSTINGADFSQPPGFEEDGFKTKGPHCYCHGGRHEDGFEHTEETASGSGCEYAYVFTDGGRMLVLSSYCEDGNKMIGFFGSGDENATWKIIGDVDLTSDTPPDWEKME